jgi:hypothetical protein
MECTASSRERVPRCRRIRTRTRRRRSERGDDGIVLPFYLATPHVTERLKELGQPNTVQQPGWPFEETTRPVVQRTHLAQVRCTLARLFSYVALATGSADTYTQWHPPAGHRRNPPDFGASPGGQAFQCLIRRGCGNSRLFVIRGAADRKPPTGAAAVPLNPGPAWDLAGQSGQTGISLGRSLVDRTMRVTGHSQLQVGLPQWTSEWAPRYRSYSNLNLATLRLDYSRCHSRANQQRCGRPRRCAASS